MGMSRPSYGQGQGSFFGRRPPPMRNPTPYFPRRVGGLSGFFGGLAGGSLPMVNKPLPFMPQQPMPQMPMPPMNQPQMPSGGGFLAQLGSSPMMQRPMPGGPGKGRSRGRRPMPGGPGKGRGQPQMPMPPRTQGPMNMPRPTPRPVPFMGQTNQIGQVGNNPPPRPTGSGEGGYGGGNIEGGYQQLPITRPGGSGFSGPAVPDFGQIRTQGPMNMGRVGNNMPRLQRPLPPNMQYGRGFYGGGITDLY